MGETPMSALTLLCSGIQLYSAEQRIADCILADVKWAASATSAELARQSRASEATVTRLCHKLGFESYRKFQLALARDVMEQQEAEKSHAAAQPDRMRSILQKFLVNKQEEVRATVQALDADQLRAALACLNAAHVVEVAAASHNLSIALEASVKFGSLGKRCVASAIPEKTRAFAATLTKNDLLLVISGTGRNPALEEVARLARETGQPSSSSQATDTRRWPSRRIMSCWLPTGSSASLRATMLPPSFRSCWSSRCCTT